MQPQDSLPTPANQTIPVPSVASAAVQPSVAPSAVVPQNINATTPVAADDGDVIESTWVNQVKQLMGQNRQSPFDASREFTKLKTEYLQKRYGKTIKAEE